MTKHQLRYLRSDCLVHLCLCSLPSLFQRMWYATSSLSLLAGGQNASKAYTWIMESPEKYCTLPLCPTCIRYFPLSLSPITICVFTTLYGKCCQNALNAKCRGLDLSFCIFACHSLCPHKHPGFSALLWLVRHWLVTHYGNSAWCTACN